MKHITLNTGLTQFFSGTYETQWEPKEYDDDGNDLPLVYSHKDLMKSIATEYANHSDYILDELQEVMPFIRKISFPKTFASPKEYNFSTDVIDYEVTIAKGEMMKVVKGLKDDKEFQDFLYENYTSRDGFWSWTPNNYDSLLYQLEKEDENDQYVQAISALMNFLQHPNTYDVKASVTSPLYESIEESVHDHWRANGYGGLDYSIDEKAMKEYKERMKTV